MTDQINKAEAKSVSDDNEGIFTEDMLIERAKLSSGKLRDSKLSSSGILRDSKRSTDSDNSLTRQLPGTEDSLIATAVLVKSVSFKTTSTATVDTESTEGSEDDEVFDNTYDRRNKDNTMSDKHTNRIPDIQVTNVDEQTVELREELKDKLAGSPRAPVVPRLNIAGTEDPPSGCRTPVNSVDEALAQQQEPSSDNECRPCFNGKLAKQRDQDDMDVKHNSSDTSMDGYQIQDDKPIDWDFDELVADVANAISATEFEEISTLLKGLDCMTEQDLIQLTTPLSYLNHLRQYNLISRDNLSHLQTIVDLIDNPDIQQKAMLFTRHKFDVVFFYPPGDLILPTYETVRCHVKGRDFTRLKRSELETIRTGIANHLFIPSQLVYIVGIEPSFSVVVTLMLHTRYIELLEEAVDESMSQLLKLGIDAVQVRGKTFSIDDEKITAEAESEYSSKTFLSVFHQLKDKNRQLEEKDEEIIRLSQETEFMQLELDTVSAELEILTERALQESVTLRRKPNQKRSYGGHTRSLSEPNREIAKYLRDDAPGFWDVWMKPTTMSGYDDDGTIRDLAYDMETLDNGKPYAGKTDLNISFADNKDKDTLMHEIEHILKELGA